MLCHCYVPHDELMLCYCYVTRDELMYNRTTNDIAAAECATRQNVNVIM